MSWKGSPLHLQGLLSSSSHLPVYLSMHLSVLHVRTCACVSSCSLYFLFALFLTAICWIVSLGRQSQLVFLGRLLHPVLN